MKCLFYVFIIFNLMLKFFFIVVCVVLCVVVVCVLVVVVFEDSMLVNIKDVKVCLDCIESKISKEWVVLVNELCVFE